MSADLLYEGSRIKEVEKMIGGNSTSRSFCPVVASLRLDLVVSCRRWLRRRCGAERLLWKDERSRLVGGFRCFGGSFVARSVLVRSVGVSVLVGASSILVSSITGLFRVSVCLAGPSRRCFQLLHFLAKVLDLPRCIAQVGGQFRSQFVKRSGKVLYYLPCAVGFHWHSSNIENWLV